VALITLGATKVDHMVADAAARCARTPVQTALKAITLAADEHALLGLAAGIWLASRAGNSKLRQKTDYLTLNVIVSAIVPHLLKRLVDQRRPDRLVHGARHGIPKSGNADDAFPSGHALHIGALAAAVSRTFPRSAGLAWIAGSVVAATRVLLLAHWLTDVLAGLAAGAALEHLLAALWPPRK
jgi:undecaprenyl-diphosphatase